MTNTIAVKPDPVTFLPSSGILSAVFTDARSGVDTGAQLRFDHEIASAKERSAQANRELSAQHERYREIETQVEKQYSGRGISTDNILRSNWKGIVQLHSHVVEIHEVADSARQDLQQIGSRSVEDFGQKMDKLIAAL